MKRPFILDTCVISEASRNRPHPDVLNFLASDNDFMLPAGALIEIHVGIMKLCATNPLKAVKMCNWYQELTNGNIPIVATDQEVCEVLGTLAAEPKLRDLILPERPSRKKSCYQDLHIAAAAIVSRAAIATFNVDDFMLINSYYPLPGIYNPLTNIWHWRMEPLFDELTLEAATDAAANGTKPRLM